MKYNYNQLSDHSLEVLLKRFKSLRYEAQIELLEEAKRRELAVDMISPLEAELERRKIAVKELGYLAQMGYDVQTNGTTTIIKRKSSFLVIEILSVLLGVVLVFVGMYGLISFYFIFTTEGDAGLQGLIVNTLLVFLGLQGFKMLRGLPRFIDNWGMKFSFSEKNVQLVKRIEFAKETFKGTASEVSLEESENTLVLLFNEERVIVGNPKSFIQHATLQSLLESIQNGSVPAFDKNATYVSE